MLPGIDEKGQYGCIGSADPANIVLVFLSVAVPDDDADRTAGSHCDRHFPCDLKKVPTGRIETVLVDNQACNLDARGRRHNYW